MPLTTHASRHAARMRHTCTLRPPCWPSPFFAHAARGCRAHTDCFPAPLSCTVEVDKHPAGIILLSQAIKGIRFEVSKEHWRGQRCHAGLPPMVVGRMVRACFARARAPRAAAPVHARRLTALLPCAMRAMPVLVLLAGSLDRGQE